MATATTLPLTDLDQSALHEFFLEELKDIYDAEHQITEALPTMIDAATSSSLKAAFEQHLSETENQIDRLDRVFESLGETPERKTCEATEGLVEEAEMAIDDTEDGSLVRDVALIASAQKVEHYEIASYGTLRTLAQLMGHDEAANLLQQNLDEEGATDKKLTQLAENHINERASQEQK